MTATTSSTRARVIIRGRSPRRGETIFNLVDRLEAEVRGIGYLSSAASVCGTVNSARSYAVELSVTLDADGYSAASVTAAAGELIAKLPADLRLRLDSWAPA